MKILLADRQALLRGALRTLLRERGHMVVAEASTGDEAVELARRLEPDVVLFDVERCRAEVMAATREIVAQRPETAVVILAVRARDDVLLEAVRAGARGFLTSDLECAAFCAMLERVTTGEMVVAPELAARLLGTYVRGQNGRRRAGSVTVLTPRERDVLERMTLGQTSNHELSAALGVSENTVRFHVRNILEKLHVHTRAAAVAQALTEGMILPGERR